MSVAQQQLPTDAGSRWGRLGRTGRAGRAGRPGRPRTGRQVAGTKRWVPAALLLPSLAVLGVVIGWPLVQLVIMSFQEFGRPQAFGAPAPWVGLQNYREILVDREFWVVLGRSVAFCLVNVVLTMVIGTLLALLMRRLPRPFRVLVSVGLLLAWAMPALTATVVWGWLFDTQYGVVNYVLSQLTSDDWSGHSWLIDPISFFLVATVIVTWGAVPFVAFTIYAGLTQVPTETLEAAALDGASGWQRFRYVVLPAMRSVFLVLLLLSIIWDMRVFTQIYALQGIGGIRDQTSTIGVYIYETSLGTGQYGTGGAISIILVVVMLLVSVPLVRRNIREEQ